MGATYTRQSSTEIVDGEVINAADFNNEFAQLVSAFAVSTGHTHDGTTAEGGPVTKLLGTAITIGDGSSGTDIAVTFDGETSDGLLTWMEDEDHFKFSDDVVIDSSKRLYVFDEGGEHISGDGTDLTVTSGADINLTATTDVNIPANVGVTFGNDGEKIEGDGTDLTISGNNINLTATADVNIPSGVGVTFATAEKIESDGTDLSITVGSGGDINIPADIGVTFGNDGEKIEGDGTDLTISGNNINLTATADVNIPSGVGITFATAEKIESDGTDLSITVGSGGDINVPANIGVTFGDDGEKIEGDGTDLTISASADLNLTATTDINIPANVGLTFGDDAEKIEGDGTDLTVSGNNINLTATADVNIPSGVGLTFATAEKIESDGTDLSITVGSGGDINVPANIGVTFGDDGEKIEGDGTDLTISSSALATIDAGTDIVLDADGGDIFFKDDGTTFGSATNTSGNLIIKSGTTTALTFSGANLTAAGTIGSGAITSTGVVTGTGFTIGSAAILEAELEILDGANVTTAELNLLDGSAKSTSSITVADADAIIVIDGTTTKQIPASDIKTYVGSGAVSAINNATANELVTIGSTTTELDAEANLTFDGSTFAVTGDATISDDLGLISDAAVLTFGANSEITVTHVHDTGLNFKHTATGDDKPIVLTLQTGETDMAANDVIGKIAFQAPDEGTGTDAILVSAAIQAVAEGDHSSSSNATRLEFHTAASEAAAAKAILTSTGVFQVGNGSASLPSLTFKDDTDSGFYRVNANQLGLTVAGTAAVRWESSCQRMETNGSESAPVYAFINDVDTGTFLSSAGVLGIAAGGDTPVTIASSVVTLAGATIKGIDGSTSSPSFHGTTSTNAGIFFPSADHMAVTIGGSELTRFGSNSILHRETENTTSTIGVTIQQGGQDDEILALKSSDVAHGLTNYTETDTYAAFRKHSATLGGLLIYAMSEASNDRAIQISGFASGTNTTKTTSAAGVIDIRASKTSGVGGAALSSNSNAVVLYSSGEAKFLVDQEGDYHYDGADGGAFDIHHDSELVSSFNSILGTNSDKPDWNRMKRMSDLKLLGSVTPEEWDKGVRPLVNGSQMQRLLVGTAAQSWVREQVRDAILANLIPGYKEAVMALSDGKNVGAMPEVLQG